MRDRFLRFAMPVLLLVMVAAACSNDDDPGATGATGDTGTTGATGTECNADIKVGIAFDVGGLGDKSFNDAANAGLQQAIADGLVCEENVVTNEANASGSDRDQNVQALADAGFNLVVGVGFAFSPDINAIAPDYPDTSFMIVDGYATCGTACGLDNDDLANVADFTFKEQEGSFLVGAAAALKCECDTIGFLGGQTGPLIQKFEAGYVAGAQAVNPDIEVDWSSTSAMTWARSTTRSRVRRSAPRCTTTAPRSSTTRPARRAPACSTRPSRRTSWRSGSTRIST